MPIPDYDGIISALPPHLGEPGEKVKNLSPYMCTMVELCTKYGTSPERIKLLQGLLAFRKVLLSEGITGFQWVAGSFVEDIELLANRPPDDIDTVTFVDSRLSKQDIHAREHWSVLGNRKYLKETYGVDHFTLPLSTEPLLLVNAAKYWYGLFTHRHDRTWKGILCVKLTDKDDDAEAEKLISGAR